MSRFQLRALDHLLFQPLFALDDAQLAAHGAVRCIAGTAPGYPCRVSLADATVGEELLLLPYQHQPAASPYRSCGPIYVRRDATQALLQPGQVPAYVTRRLISLRGYDDRDMMVTGQVHEGPNIGDALEELFTRHDVAYAHLHNARQGCFSCLATRVGCASTGRGMRLG